MGGSSQIMGLVKENARLKAENERVLSDNKLLIVKLNTEHIVRQNVEADNTKLRELVREMYWDLLAEMPESLLEDRLSQMHELGVES